MYKLNNITSDYKQSLEWITPNGESVNLYLEYLPNQLGWFLNLKYQDKEIRKLRITTNANILRAYNSYLPFGLLCRTDDMGEPIGLNDFASGYAQLCILTRQECKKLEDNYYVKV